MNPLEMLELCGIDMNSAPVALAVASNHCQRSSGYGLSVLANGRNFCAVSASASVNTTRCKFAPPGIELHSQPTNAVNFPGS